MALLFPLESPRRALKVGSCTSVANVCGLRLMWLKSEAKRRRVKRKRSRAAAGRPSSVASARLAPVERRWQVMRFELTYRMYQTIHARLELPCPSQVSLGDFELLSWPTISPAVGRASHGSWRMSCTLLRSAKPLCLCVGAEQILAEVERREGRGASSPIEATASAD